MRWLFFVIINLWVLNGALAQGKFLAKDGYVSFFSHSLLEDIKADNNQVLSIIDTDTGSIAIQLLMRSFMFKKALMQEHFNENYVESYKYPKATFSGKIKDFDTLNRRNGKTEIVGVLSIHGRKKEISTMAMIEFINNEIVLKGEFWVEVADFDIKIPKIVENNIAKSIKVNFELHHKPYN
ncbi:YceI family protein [Arenibacter sp. 6A1]|uniref:YceI family protein n=1 Tax=Arenibacter sp. 6A1 TaxID=2720391 RepID=UPI0014478304|nr:YceI family protein [Arenibacter sp. 6A1]NKI27545.1 YceI family protein [Arenibacter sp. 6A1]